MSEKKKIKSLIDCRLRPTYQNQGAFVYILQKHLLKWAKSWVVFLRLGMEPSRRMISLLLLTFLPRDGRGITLLPLHGFGSILQKDLLSLLLLNMLLFFLSYRFLFNLQFLLCFSYFLFVLSFLSFPRWRDTCLWRACVFLSQLGSALVFIK